MEHINKQIESLEQYISLNEIDTEAGTSAINNLRLMHKRAKCASYSNDELREIILSENDVTDFYDFSEEMHEKIRDIQHAIINFYAA